MSLRSVNRPSLFLVVGLFLLAAFLFFYQSKASQFTVLSFPKPFTISTGKWFEVEKREVLSDFQFVGRGGKWNSFSEYAAGSPVLLIFWRTDCPICIEEFERVKALQADKPISDMKILGISEDPSLILVQRFEAKRAIPFDWGWDQDGLIARSLSIKGVPTVWMIDREGRIAYKGFRLPEDYGEIH
jgi:peroxiredoxin